MHKQTFGCYCGVFSLALSSNGILIPGSKGKPIYRSFFPLMEMTETAGHYVLRATNEDYVICETSNAQQHSQAILVFLFTYWEDEIRPRLAKSMNIAANEIRSDIMGDLRIIRNVILHSKGITRRDKHSSLKLLGDMFAIDQPVYMSYESMHKIFVLIKQDCARLLFEWLGIKNSPNLKPAEFVDVALQIPRKSH